MRRILNLPRARCFYETRLFSSSNSSGQIVFPNVSTMGLGLDVSFVHPHLDSIQQLPEVSEAIQTKEKSCELLSRASEVFESIQAGGKEHVSVLAFLAERQIRAGNSEGAIRTLQEVTSLVKDDARKLMDVEIALCKALWLAGQFSEAKTICDNLLEDDRMEGMPLHEASARTGQALCRLSLATGLEDAFSLRDPARMAVKCIEPYKNAALPLAAAELNFGIAEAVYAEIVGRENDVETPLDNAMRAWKRGLTAIKRHRKDNPVAAHLEARLEANMAWGLLKMTNHPNHVDQASEHAGKSLKIYDRWLQEDDDKEGMERTLSVVATCFHQSSQAVTAEGLFQSALDKISDGPQMQLDRYYTLKAYSNLCQDWDKRAPDAEKLERDAEAIQAKLPQGWQGKSALHSSLWFWTPNLFAS